MYDPLTSGRDAPPAPSGVRWAQVIVSVIALALTTVALLVAMTGKPWALVPFVVLAWVTAELARRGSKR